MPIEIRTVAGHEFDVVVLQAADARAEIWPALGGNCIRWFAPVAGELLYDPPLEELIQRTTRGGIPVLFPFPNRIRGGGYVFAGRTFQLPKNDSSGPNAIHGFTPRHAWRFTATENTATLTFRISRDAPECLDTWPADGELQITYTLAPSHLAVHCRVANPGVKPFPFGLGFHPYFRVATPDDWLTIHAAQRWELVDQLPTGKLLANSGSADLRHGRPLRDLQLDDVYTDVTSLPNGDGLRELGHLKRSDGVRVAVLASSAFREVVAFTPTHRQAVCIEPYTCPTDAVHLTASGREVGWRVLAPGDVWQADVAYEMTRTNGAPSS